MRWEMEILSPTSYLSDSNWLIGQSKGGNWTPYENKLFEKTLAKFDKETPDRWQKVANMIPGKTEDDVMRHYTNLVKDVSDIEAGLVPIPAYSSSITLDWATDPCFEGLKQSYGAGARRAGARLSDQERKKGVPWTEEEHRLFLMGLEKHGKGDWRNISRNFVISRTPTQVASHAQKYFIRRNSGGKDKRRSSIHDITTINLQDNGPPSPSQLSAIATHQSSVTTQGTADQFSMIVDSNQNHEATRAFHRAAPQNGNLFMQPTYGINLYGLKYETQNFHRSSLQEPMIVHENMLFQLQSTQCHPHG